MSGSEHPSNKGSNEAVPNSALHAREDSVAYPSITLGNADRRLVISVPEDSRIYGERCVNGCHCLVGDNKFHVLASPPCTSALRSNLA